MGGIESGQRLFAIFFHYPKKSPEFCQKFFEIDGGTGGFFKTLQVR